MPHLEPLQPGTPQDRVRSSRASQPKAQKLRLATRDPRHGYAPTFVPSPTKQYRRKGR
jgi:hypothetical protein